MGQAASSERQIATGEWQTACCEPLQDALWQARFPEVQQLIDSATLQARVRELGEQIAQDYDPNDPPLLVGVLKGSLVFLADLMRYMPIPVSYDFVAISSYGAETHSSGVVRLLKDLDASIAGRHVLVVEDILDTGLTLSYLLELLRMRNPASLKVCTLLRKPSRQKVTVPVDYCGFDIPDQFVVGYGLDYAERYRNLPFIGVLTSVAVAEK
ncbi:MAG: hypoxanthine phosphoribosyltransferase [Fimbriimonadales bacterium]|nr:hypoxanthine phosphoribosyltransferase [Fimbriimonadales bacterium]